MCNTCNNRQCTCTISQAPVICEPCLNNKYCVDKMDTDCIFYHLDEPNEISKLTCIGVPSNTSLSIILEEIDKRLCGLQTTFDLNEQDTNTVNTTVTNSGNVYTVKSDVKIDPSSTAPITIGPNGIKIDCCSNLYDCSSVTKTVNYSLSNIVKGNNFFNSLQPNYFTKSDIILNVIFNDLSVLSGDTLTYLKYTLFPNSVNISTTIGGTKSLYINECAKNIVNKHFTMLVEMLTSRGCYSSKVCEVTTYKVPYSERINYPYRANFQMDNLPIVRDITTSQVVDKGILYFNDVRANNTAASLGGVIRKINLNSGEVTTIAGTITGGSVAVTQNGATGNLVSYDYPSGPIIDSDEMSNGEPVIYFATFGKSGINGGYVCRLVKETNDKCNERENWVNYVIAGNGTFANTVPTYPSYNWGINNGFHNLYGLKKWFTVNGAPSFLVVDTANGKIYLLYKQGAGSLNDQSSWKMTYFGLTISSSIEANINIDSFDWGKRIIKFSAGFIECLEFTISNPTLSQLCTLSNYVSTVVVNNGVGNLDGNSSLAKVANISCISKYIDFGNSSEYYIFANGDYGLPSVTTSSSMLRRFERNLSQNSMNPVNFSTLIPSNTNILGSSGLLSSTNGFSQGFFQDLQGSFYDITLGGIRKWELLGDPTDNCVIYSGGTTSTSTNTSWVGFNQAYMDTQYEYKLNC